MSKLTVTKKFEFCYAHRLVGYDGPCAFMHGHNAELEVTFSSVPDQYPSMVLDFRRIKTVVGPIIERLDHSLLEDNELLGGPPTAETIVKFIADQIIQGPYKEIGAALAQIRLSETPDSWVTWTRED